MMHDGNQPPRQRMAGMIIGLQGLLVLSASMFATIIWAAEPVEISSLLSYPESYKMKVVRVEGTVSRYRMHHFIGNRTKLEKCIQDFSVADDTGTIDATYATICQMGTVMLKDGDRVTVEAHFWGNLDVRSVTKN